MPHPFDILATPIQAIEPDVLIIFWGNTPQGSTGSMYLPAVNVADVLGLAEGLFGPYNMLTAADNNTVQIPARPGTATFIPLPAGTVRFAGLLTVDLPAGVKAGDRYDISVQQTTLKSATIVPPSPPSPPPQRGTNPSAASSSREVAKVATKMVDAVDIQTFYWRQVTGAFQISIVISSKEPLLFPEERLLSWLRWKLSVVPQTNRWFPVLQRYEQQVSGRVSGFGGDPGTVLPSPIGNPWDCGDPRHHRGHHRCHGRHGEHKKHRKCKSFAGKICRLEFDRCGEFVGFVLLLARERHGNNWKGRDDDDESEGSEREDREQSEKHFCIREGREGREKVRELVERCMVGGRVLIVYVEVDESDCIPVGFGVK